ncbi:MAG: DUF4118 domain-containing protein [Lachnospiraceae bacterium]|nr:DUF4118 domain-containing protein [Lachnospiraceae bacterium]
MRKKYFRGQDWVIMTILLLLAGAISRLLLPNTGVENNSALIFVVAVVMTARLTSGYLYGVMAAVISVLCVNYFFMYPYLEFNISLTGYTVAMISMLLPATIVSVLTAQLKKHARAVEEREKRTRELYERNAELEKEKTAMELESAKAAIRSNLLMAVSHDLRTPLTAISGSASYILSRGMDGSREESLKLVKDIKDDAEWLTVMVENILSVTRLRDADEPLRVSAELPDEIIGSSVMKIRRRFPEASVECELSDGILLAQMDPLLIQQVLINLLENGIRHAESKDPIRISAAAAGENKVRFMVEDHGKGLPESIAAQIREDRPVVVDRRGDSYRGMGIGLAVCQSILKAHHSRLEVQTGEGGTAFMFDLDRVRGEENL